MNPFRRNIDKKLQGNIDEAEYKLADEVKQKFDVARLAKQPKVDIWNRCIDAYNSDYFKNKNKPDYKSDEISNFIFSTVETIKPIMVDNDPKIIVLPKTPNGVSICDRIQNAFDAEWQRSRMGKKLVQGITVALQIGTAIYMIPWDKHDENGLGNVNPILINPYNFFPDPMATDMDNAEYAVYATYKHVNILKQRYPRKADSLEAGTINYKELVSQDADTSNVKNQVLVLECWMRDYTTMDKEIDDPDNDGKKIKVRERKYKNGRVLTVAPDLHLVLEDKESPYEDGKFPFHLLKCYDVPFEFWGKGEIEQLLSPQTYINDLMNQIIDNARLTANMPWILDKNSGIGKGQLTNRPGLIIRKNPGTEVKREQPPAMPNYVKDMVETLKQDVEIISGVHDITQGRKPGSVSAASAIVALQEAAQARIRLKVKLMELTLSEIGAMWYNRMRQFWVTNRWIRLYDQTELQDPQFVEVTPEDLQVDVDILILGGSTMPSNKNAMLDLMVRLAQTPAEDSLPMIDRETVLQYTNIPDKKKIVQRFTQRAQANQQAQMQAQQAAMQQAQMAEQAKVQQAQQAQTMQMQGKMTMQDRQIQADMQKESMRQQHDNGKMQMQMSENGKKQIMDMLKQNPEMLMQMLQQMGVA
jgi:hypothetical protein